MAKERSDACRYPSKYAPGEWVTAAQLTAELMCERQAAKKGQALARHFWLSDEWKWPYQRQLLLANKLFKLYDPAAVGAALRTHEGRRLFSLAAPGFDRAVRLEDERVRRERAARAERAAEPAPPPPEPLPPATSRPAFVPKNKKSIRDRLKE